MCALEALNGMPVGLTTAFLFSVLQGAWSPHAREKSVKR